MDKVTYACSGTLGDAYINVLKLLTDSLQGKDITVNHFTVHEAWRGKIREIYDLIPSLTLSFPESRDTKSKKIASHFAEDDGMPVIAFPSFGLPAFPMPAEYIVISPRAGKDGQLHRSISSSHMKGIIGDADVPVYILGSYGSSGYAPRHVIDLMGRTKLWQAFKIIAGAKLFFAPQGLLTFFALSQKVRTVVYCSTDQDLSGFYNRLLPEWKEYLIGIRTGYEHVEKIDG